MSELTPICFEDGFVANIKYGVPVRNGGPCPRCNVPVDTALAYNPFDFSYYFYCFSCQKWFRWCDINGKMLDLAIVTTSKKGQDLDEMQGLNSVAYDWMGMPI